MKAIRRVDRLKFRVDASSVRRHKNGWLDVWGVAAVVGVLQYPEFGTAELVDASTLFEPASLATLRGIPLTIDHPAGGEDVTSSNARELTHGVVMDWRADADTGELWTHTRLWTDDALDSLRDGTVELSLAYDAVYEEGAGQDANGTPYTGRQIGRRYNHQAQVDRARAGPGARYRLDSARRDARRWGMHELTIRGYKRKVAKFIADSLAAESAKLGKDSKRRDQIETAEISIDGTTLVLPMEMVDALLASLGISSGGSTAPAEADPTMDDAPAPTTPPPAPRSDAKDKPQAKDKPMTAEEVRQYADAQVGVALQAERQRAAIERKAFPILGESHDYSEPWSTAAAAIGRVDSAKETEAKRYADKARDDKAGEADRARAQGYLLARLDDAAEAHRDELDSSGYLGAAIDHSRQDGASTQDAEPKTPIADARKRMIERSRNAGKKPATTTEASN